MPKENEAKLLKYFEFLRHPDFAGAAPVPAHRFRETHQERMQAHRALLSSADRFLDGLADELMFRLSLVSHARLQGLTERPIYERVV
jgi:hypothetical protein